MPSGMLWMAIATATGTAMDGCCSAEIKVAIPSGKLCTAMASAVNTPTRISLCLGALADFASAAPGSLPGGLISCGFS